MFIDYKLIAFLKDETNSSEPISRILSKRIHPSFSSTSAYTFSGSSTLFLAASVTEVANRALINNGSTKITINFVYNIIE